MRNKKQILFIIVLAQFCCTSLWFAGNGVIGDLTQAFQLSDSALSYLTSAVQLGFIIGTLVFALLTIADRFSPSLVFFVCAIFGAGFNLALTIDSNTFISLFSLRLLIGFSLAGIYPVGMKIAADYFDKGLGKSLGFLVGALVVGTAFPHLLKGYSGDLPWQSILMITSGVAFSGGLMIWLLVPNGPFRRPSPKTDLRAFFTVFKNRKFRAAAFGYFGHMWELYAFWTFVPVMLLYYQNQQPDAALNIPYLSFLIIGLGGLACVAGGYLSQHVGTKKTAMIALLLSGLCCLASPLIFSWSSSGMLIGFLIFWGLVVIADSPLFSTLVAQNAIAESKGTALTIVNCIGFSITIFSIQLIDLLIEQYEPRLVFPILALGPILGLLALTKDK